MASTMSHRGALSQVLGEQLQVLKPANCPSSIGDCLVMAWQRRPQTSTSPATDATESSSSLTAILQSTAKSVPKAVVLAALFARVLTSTTSNMSSAKVLLVQLLPAVLTNFVSSLAVRKSPGVVFPVAILGVIGGHNLAGTLAAAAIWEPSWV